MQEITIEHQKAYYDVDAKRCQWWYFKIKQLELFILGNFLYFVEPFYFLFGF